MERQKAMKISGLVLLSMLATTMAALAVIKYSGTISNTATIKGYEVSLWRIDSNAKVTAITWGDIETGTAKTTEQVFGFTEKLEIKNTGDFPISFLEWKVNGTLPSGITVTAQYKNSGWTTWAENTPDDTIARGGMAVGEYSLVIQFDLAVANGASRGPIIFDILLLAPTTISG